jgi:DNA excision repair protein ERCC-2
MIERLSAEIQLLMKSINRKTIVFFPSRILMNKVLKIIGTKGLLVDSGEMDQIQLTQLVGKFKSGKKTMFTVIGGRLSEGINLPGNLLEIVIIAGIPYPKPDVKQRTLMAYYDHLYGKGWDYAVTFPTLIKLRQTIGRLIRTFEDRGVAIILDERAESFSEYIKGMKQLNDVSREVSKFFSNTE